MKKPFLTRLLTFGIGGTLLTGAQAATVVTATAANADHPPFTGNAFPPFWSDNFSPANDLLRGLTPAATGNFAAYADMDLATVNDGVLTPLPVSNASVPMLASVGSGGGGTQLIYTLSQTSLVSSIRYFGGWTDSGRVDINVTVSFSVDGGLTYTPLIDAAGRILLHAAR